MSDKPKTVLIGMPSGSGMVDTMMLQSLLQLHKPIPCGFITVVRQRVDKARNAIALEALRGGFDYLLFVDDDNPIPVDTLERMLEDDKDIVIAPILGRNPDPKEGYKLCAFYAEPLKLKDDKTINLYRNIKEFRDEGLLHKIDAGGTGCMLIKRKVLEAMYAKYGEQMFAFGEVSFEKTIVDGVEYDKRTMSEDCEFSERAINLGFEMWLDERVKPIHFAGVQSVQWKGKE